MQRLTILGATGSIGMSTLDVVARHPDKYRVYALSAQNRIEQLAVQCERFQPEIVVVGSAASAQALRERLRSSHLKIEIQYGPQALCEIASATGCDAVMAAIVGAAGLESALAAARAGKKILLANKEALVMSGRLFIDAVHANNAALLPIDSEHNAIFQCLPCGYQRSPEQHGIAKILLTASGGPFRTRAIETLDNVTPEEAIAHPNWVMGRKISVDSATMMNKGLEVIEAHWLFGAESERIEVVIHPQSVIHSMVSYVDGSVLAQLGNPDMRTPIAHALAYPERIASGVAPLDLPSIAELRFERPDLRRFPCLKLAYHALKAGGTAPAILNAANEVAVQAFLEQRIGFRAIDELIARVLDAMPHSDMSTIESLLEEDKRARALADSCVAAIEGGRRT